MAKKKHNKNRSETLHKVTQQKKNDQYLQVLALKETPVGVALLSGKEHIITFANPRFCGFTGKSYEKLINKSVWEAIPEVKGQGFEQLLEEVLITGVPYIGSEIPVRLMRNGRFETGYFSFVFNPIRDQEGNVHEIMVIATEVTDKVKVAQAVQQEREHFYEIFMHAPAVIAVLKGPNHIIDLINPLAKQAIGIKRDVVGKTVSEALPEIESQGFIDILNTVYKTGKPFIGNEIETKVDIEETGMLVTFYYNFVFQPDFDLQGNVQGVFVYAINVTEEVLSRKKIEDNEKQLATILRSITDAFICFDNEWRYTYVNDEACRILDKTSEELIGKIVWDAFPEFEESEAGQIFLKAAKTGKKIFFQNYYPPLRKWFDVRVYPEKDGLITNFRDITQAKILELERSRLASVVAESDDAIWSITLDGKIVSWNKGAEQIYGYKAKNVLGKSSSLLVPKEKRKELRDTIKKILEGKKLINFDTKRKKKNGEIIDVSATVSPVKDVRGNIIGVSIIARDITNKKRIEQKIKLSEERFRTLIAKSADAIILLDKKRKIIYTSDSVERVIGYRQEDLFKTDALQYIYPEDVPLYQKEFARLLEKPGNQASLTFRMRHKNGIWIWVEATGVNHLDNPAVRAIVGNFRDVTQRKLLEKQKEEFLGIASHELKTPVTSIKAFAQVLQQRFSKAGNEDAAELLGKINGQINKLISLIQDLLDVSKVESGKLKLHKDRFRLDIMIEEVVEEVQRTSETHKIIINERTRQEVYADRERISQVVTNFLTNAVKYSPRNSQIIVFSKSDKKNVTVCVKDFGFGIAKENLPHIFERFFRIPEKTFTTIPGMGLGLNIASEIIKRHKGKIWVESKEGKGSTFCFSLPR